MTAMGACISISTSCRNDNATEHGCCGAAKKKMKLNKTKVVLKVGKKTTLKLKNNKKKVKWSSNKKKVATVTKKVLSRQRKKELLRSLLKLARKNMSAK